jgi:hypothetical protein
MSAIAQSECFREDFVNSEISRIATRKFSEVIDDILAAKRWTKAELARQAQGQFPDLEIRAEQVYEWLEGKHEPRAWFTKAMEWTLGINLPPHCYFNVGKR